MTAFYVGQRVRIIAADGGSKANAHVGKEAVVNELDTTSQTLKKRIGVTIAGCQPGYGYSDSDWCFDADQLEPIQHRPDKQQLEEYDKEIVDLVSTSLSVIAEGVREHA